LHLFGNKWEFNNNKPIAGSKYHWISRDITPLQSSGY